MQPPDTNAKGATGAQREAGEQGVTSCATPTPAYVQTVIVEILDADPRSQQVLDWFIGEEPRHHIQLPVAPSQAAEHEGPRRISHARVLARSGVLRVQLRHYADLAAHLSHNPQMIEVFYHIRCYHLLPSCCWLSPYQKSLSSQCKLRNVGSMGHYRDAMTINRQA